AKRSNFDLRESLEDIQETRSHPTDADKAEHNPLARRHRLGLGLGLAVRIRSLCLSRIAELSRCGERTGCHEFAPTPICHARLQLGATEWRSRSITVYQSAFFFDRKVQVKPPRCFSFISSGL